jgi:hypothetical protein
MQAASARIEADHLARVRGALLKLADAHEAGRCPPALGGIAGKKELLAMLATRVDHSGGHYSLRDTGEFHDTSKTAVALREWLDGRQSPEDKAAQEEAARVAKIRDLEARVRFAQIPGFFPTPAPVIARMIDLADVLGKTGLRVLEPSAGKGDIADAVRGAFPDAAVDVCEINHQLREILTAKGHTVIGEDFLQLPAPEQLPSEMDATGRSWTARAELYDRVLANPPFESGQDILHVRHAHALLRPGGRLVSVMSTGPFFRADRKAAEFREWFDEVGGERYDLPDGAFEGAFRSTGVKTCLVVVDR